MSPGSRPTRLGIMLSVVRYEERRLLDELADRGVAVDRLDPRSLTFGPGEAERLRGMTVLNREIAAQRAVLMAETLEELGAFPVNDSSSTRICCNKWSTYLRLRDHGIPTPTTLLAPSPEAGMRAVESVGYPAVIKPLGSSWGKRVSLITDRYAAEAVLEHSAELPSAVMRTVIVQEAVQPGAPDIRGIVVDGEFLGAVVRSGTDWRNNVARGAAVEPLGPNDEVRELCTAAAAAVGARVVSVDLVRYADGGHLVLEVNSRMEFQGFEGATRTDVAAKVIDLCLSGTDVKEPV
ncbi:RimK family alpha-L-glutamate ligase [Actinosynnema sp. NPDC023658]|uniref:ATP-grasp domain-containing protein n=1 Tax=Actinosynnema sp. NPDC023658 TaxID=3155465 RepID=UPI0033D2904A